MKKRISKILACVVAAVMCFAMLPQLAFADTPENEGGETRGLVVFGSSTASGYGLSDFVNKDKGFNVNNNDLDGAWTVEAAKEAEMGRISNHAYPWQLKKYLEEKEGASYELSSFAMNGMRTDEFRAILDEDYYMRAFNREKEKTWYYETDDEGNKVLSSAGFMSDRVNYFVQALGHGGATVDVNGTEVPVWTEADNINIDGLEGIYGLEGTSGEAFFRAQKYVKEKVRNANVIVVDNCMNNFGTYLAHRIGAAAGAPGYEKSLPYSKQNLDDIDGASDGIWAKVRVLQKKLLEDSDLIKNALAKELLNAFLFCYADCVTNFSAEIDLIRELNPDAKIIVVGLYNPLEGVKINLDGRVIDIGKYAGYAYKAVDAYLQSFDKNNSDYYYADISEGIETFMTKMASFDDFDEFMKDDEGKNLLDNMYSGDHTSFFESFLGEENMPDIVEAATQTAFDDLTEEPDGTEDPALWFLYELKYTVLNDCAALLTEEEKDPSSNDVTWKDLNTLAGLENEDLKARIETDGSETVKKAFEDVDIPAEALHNFIEIMKAAIQEELPDELKTRIQKLLFEAAKYDTLDLEAIAAAMKDTDAVKAKLMDALSPGKTPPAEIMGLFHILDRFMLYMSVGQHPDENGCDEIFHRVRAAYEKEYPASGELVKKIAGQLSQLGDKINAAASETNLSLLQRTLEAIASQINSISAMLDESDKTLPAIAPLVEKLNDQINKTLEIAKKFAGIICEKAKNAKDSIGLQTVAGQIDSLRSLIPDLCPLNSSNSLMQKSILEQLKTAGDTIRDKVASISDDLTNQIRSIKDKLKDAAGPKAFKALMGKLVPVGEKLSALGKTMIELPSAFHSAMKLFMEVSKAVLTGQNDGTSTLQNKLGSLTAELIEAGLSARLSFKDGKGIVSLSWAKDETASGYSLTVNGKTVKATETKNGFLYRHTGVKMGKTYTFTVTPYVVRDVNGEAKKFEGKTFRLRFVPRVSLGRLILKKVAPGKKSFKATWKKTAGAGGYQIFYKAEKKVEYKLIAGAKKTVKTISKLWKGKKYTVKVRAYKQVNGKKYFGGWSKIKIVKIR